MAKANSISTLLTKAASGTRAHLKALGIDVPEVDSGSDEPHLRALQELQAIEAALMEHVGKKAAPALSSSDMGKKA